MRMLIPIFFFFVVVVVISLSEQSLSKYRIRLHTSIPESSHFKLTKLGPDRNNVRRTALTQLPSEASSHQCDPEPDSSLPPTPHYNAALLHEQGAMERHLHDLYAAMQECPAMVDAVVLCKVWVKQRGLDQVGKNRRRNGMSCDRHLPLSPSLSPPSLAPSLPLSLLLPQGLGGFTGFHCAMLMVTLLQQKQLNKLMSSYQILRILLQHLGNRA